MSEKGSPIVTDLKAGKPELFGILLHFRDSPQGGLSFNYHGRGTVQSAYDKIKAARENGDKLVEIKDDYGSVSQLDPTLLISMTISDTTRILEHGADQGILKAHTQMKFEARVQNDPTLKFLRGLQFPGSAPGAGMRS